VRRELDRHVVAKWGDRDIHTISKRDVLDLLDGIVDSGRGDDREPRAGLSREVLQLVRRTRRDPASPMTGVKRPAKETSRDRVLQRRRNPVALDGGGAGGATVGAARAASSC
jgi:hypothetical protein